MTPPAATRTSATPALHSLREMEARISERSYHHCPWFQECISRSSSEARYPTQGGYAEREEVTDAGLQLEQGGHPETAAAHRGPDTRVAEHGRRRPLLHRRPRPGFRGNARAAGRR